MADINVTFCRKLLKRVMDDIKRLTSPAERKAAWVYHFSSGDQWEFHGPDRFYWHGRADNAYDARAQGWQAWMDRLSSEGAATRLRLAGERERAEG